MALLIPGPKSLGKDFDVFLEPLIEDLLDLWKGVPTYDALTGKTFSLRAVVLWCIHDYPALSTLSGRTTKGYFACIHCDKHPLSYGLRSKTGYFGHVRFLPKGHRLRRNNEYVGLHESDDPLEKFTIEELLAELQKVRDVRPGKQQETGKRKRSKMEAGRVRIWSRMVSLWKLPYWKFLKLRHNLDVMHIEKNICEALIGTILNILGKTKDIAKARLDLKDLGIKKELQFRDDGESCEMPHARYTLSTRNKKAFCDFLRKVKFPDGFASNISRCVNAEGTKVQGLKTHDCHILLQRILPAAMRGFLDNDIYESIAELGKFFRELCRRKLNKDVLVEMKKEIPIILMKLEKIFPPAFFDVMMHLAVHLPDEALLRGPVQFGWMYLIERRLYTLKCYVRNRARPEGSIAEAYVANECLTFCSKYMDDVETRFNREPRNKGFSDEEAYGVGVFGHGVHFTSANELVYDENSFEQMVCMFRDELETTGVHNVERKIRLGFQNWFRNHIMRLRDTHQEEVDDGLFSLACGPDFRVRKYSSCIVNGVRFNTIDRDKNKKTQNSGVMTQEIIQLEYNFDERTVVLFKCEWFKLDGRRTELNYDGFFKSINVGSLWYKDNSLILATQARKVFYLPDTKLGDNWQVVQTFNHRHLYNVSETESAQYNAPAYQEDECCEDEQRQEPLIGIAPEMPLNRDDEQGLIFGVDEIARMQLKKPPM
ncbi:uncharacterized protein LOC120645374 [Panicum virgatum]|uniref:uncharacterized protein LOC120645374 n=1 Tax=Panicum virgatum TaxID=38727 RepID=UPI0019D57910|nr:uncharacterized protein LOC120645374 [Panicum virgatum]